MTPPWVEACTVTPADVAIMAPASTFNCSPGSRVQRATAMAGRWRTSTFMGGDARRRGQPAVARTKSTNKS